MPLTKKDNKNREDVFFYMATLTFFTLQQFWKK